MTEEDLHQLIEAVVAKSCRECADAARAGRDVETVAGRQAAIACQLLLPAVESLVQEALEQGFNGRADAEPPWF